MMSRGTFHCRGWLIPRISGRGALFLAAIFWTCESISGNTATSVTPTSEVGSWCGLMNSSIRSKPGKVRTVLEVAEQLQCELHDGMKMMSGKVNTIMSNQLCRDLILGLVAGLMVFAGSAVPALAELRIGNVCRIKGQEENTLQGMGLV